ncbi:MAG: alpha/beta hydrolase [Eudoraea sp.]|uniref:alpha/beta hydrolase n=1 Tax=Eudoraea sp. TaxID=1979955 RepID=UPI0032630EA9
MKYFLLLNLLIWTSFSFAQTDLQLVNIGDFTTTDGNVIKDCKVGYKTVGKLNPDKNNVVLIPTWFGESSENIVSSGALYNVLDTTGLYVIIVDALTAGISSSPSITANFPKVSIRDMVNSQHDLLVNHLKIDHVYAVMSFSMGAMQTFEWLVAYPEFMDKAIPMLGTPKQSFYDILLWQTQADLINEAGIDEEDINLAMKRAYDIFNINIRTPSFFVSTKSLDSLDVYKNEIHSNMISSKDYLAQVNAMIQHDIYKSSKSNPDTIKNVVKADVLIIINLHDHAVNPTSSIAFSKVLGCRLVELTSDYGHTSFFYESKKVKKAVSDFLE